MNKVIWPFWDSGERRLRLVLRLALTLLLFLLLTVAGGIFLVLAFRASPTDPGMTVFGSAVSLGATLGATTIAARWISRRPFGDYGFHFGRAWVVDLAFGLALGALLMTGIFLVERAAGWITVTEWFFTNHPTGSFVAGWGAPVILFLCVGIYEELLTRGFFLREVAEGIRFGRLDRRLAVLAAYLISSLVFGLLHADNPNATAVSTGNLIIAGIFLGLPYVLTGELALSIGLHITWNFFQGNVFGFPVSGLAVSNTTLAVIQQGGPELWTGGDFGPEAGIMGLLALALGSALIVLWMKATGRPVRPFAGLATYHPRYPASTTPTVSSGGSDPGTLSPADPTEDTESH